jgi:hypothetical protein
MVILRSEDIAVKQTGDSTIETTEEAMEEKTERTITSGSPRFAMARIQRSPSAQLKALKAESQVLEAPTHDLHQGGHLALVGRGRFAKKGDAMKLLWQTKKLGQNMQLALESPNISGKVAFTGPSTAAAGGTSYIVHT